jgi:hypothetical protein
MTRAQNQGSGEMVSGRLMSRGGALSITVLLHLGALVGFLSGLHVGLPVQLHPDAHPSDTRAPLIASIISLSDNDTAITGSTLAPLKAESIASPPIHFDVPIPTPAWQSEDDPTPSITQPAPAPGRMGLRCEIHIHQSLAGQVQAIDFGECTGDAVWQRTLLQTVERAAQLVRPAPDVQFPPVRTLTVGTDNLSPIVLAQQLSSAEMFEMQTNSNIAEVSRSR